MRSARQILLGGMLTCRRHGGCALRLGTANQRHTGFGRRQPDERIMSGSLSYHTLSTKKNLTRSFVAALALIPLALLAQSLAPTPSYSDQAELFKAEEWVLSQGAAESIAPELAAILGLGSDRLPVKLKSYRASDGVSIAFAVSTNPKQEGIVLSALKTMADKMKIYSVGTAWLTDSSGTLRRTIAVDASGARILPDSSRASEFKNIKAFFLKKLQATNPSTAASPSPRISGTAAGGKKETK
jgi:hypothetical protein